MRHTIKMRLREYPKVSKPIYWGQFATFGRNLNVVFPAFQILRKLLKNDPELNRVPRVVEVTFTHEVGFIKCNILEVKRA